MTRAPHPKAYRFVVVYRAETREIEGAAEVRRGWIEQVLDPRSLDAGAIGQQRLGFHTLAELPGLIGRMIEAAEAPDSQDRRPPT